MANSANAQDAGIQSRRVGTITRARRRPAKLTRPRLHNAIPRQRLFDMLDSLRRTHRALYLAAAPGAGKTTLVSSWLDCRGDAGIWIQVDAGDSDASTFFHHLGDAARAYARGRRLPLPALTPEYLHDVAGFARRFFRELFRRMPAESSLVLDNYHEVGEGCDLHRLVAMAVEELTEGQTLVLISREAPPAAHARLLANEYMALIDWQVIKLTATETDEFVARRLPQGEVVSAHMHRLCDGWAAGLTLLCDRVARGQGIGELHQPESMASVFQYFASEFFGRMPEAEQRLLLALSHFPRITSTQAVEVSGRADAASVLANLYRRGLFVDQRGGSQGEYQFHALFLAFLRQRRTVSLPPAEAMRTGLDAARILARDGHSEAAIALFGGYQANQEALDVALRAAPEWIAQGRWRLVVHWMDRLPTMDPVARAWQYYWRGLARSHVDPVGARQDLELAHAGAQEAGQLACQGLSCAAILHTLEMEYARFRAMDPWIERLQHLLQRLDHHHDPDLRLRLLAGLMAGMMHRKPEDARLADYADRLQALLPGAADANLKVLAGTYLLTWGSLSGPIQAVRRVRPLLQQWVKEPGVSPANACRGWFLLGWSYHVLCDSRSCLAALEVGMDILDREGLPQAQRILGLVVGIWSHLENARLSEAREWLGRMDGILDHTNPYDVASAEGIRAWMAVLADEPDAALTHAERAIGFFDVGGCVYHQGAFRLPLIWGHVLRGDYAQARFAIDECGDYLQRLGSRLHKVVLLMTQAWIARKRGETALLGQFLGDALRMSREHGYEHAHGAYLGRVMPELCVEALERRIEPDYVVQLIGRFGWHAPPGRPPCWPWAVRIHALGDFRIEVGGSVLAFHHKTPRRPLLLLKALIALGEVNVPAQRLMDALWPDEDGDQAYHSLGITLHRLRQLLGHAQTVVLSDSRLSLDTGRVWTDVGCFERQVELSAADSDARMRALRLYGGPFLDHIEDAPWALLARERLHAKYRRLMQAQPDSQREARRHARPDRQDRRAPDL